MKLVTLLCLLFAIPACQSMSGTATRTCTTDHDCTGSTICQVCNQTCVFAPNAACSLDAPCPCGYSCRNQRCTTDLGVAAAMCTYDRDCQVDQFCNRAQFQCQFPMVLGAGTGVTCTTNAECADGDICSTAGGANAGQCAPNETIECHNDMECPTGSACGANGQCVHHSC